VIISAAARGALSVLQACRALSVIQRFDSVLIMHSSQIELERSALKEL
jgi:hypothetical protein